MLEWTTPIDKIDAAHYLPIFLDGIREKVYPFDFVAREGAFEILRNGNRDQILSSVDDVVIPIKAALDCHDPESMMLALQALQALTQISTAIAAALVPHYRQLFQSVNLFKSKRRNLGDQIDFAQFKNDGRCLGDKIEETLTILETTAGPEAFPFIKYMIPTYESCLSLNPVNKQIAIAIYDEPVNSSRSPLLADVEAGGDPELASIQTEVPTEESLSIGTSTEEPSNPEHVMESMSSLAVVNSEMDCADCPTRTTPDIPILIEDTTSVGLVGFEPDLPVALSAQLDEGPTLVEFPLLIVVDSESVAVEVVDEVDAEVPDSEIGRLPERSVEPTDLRQLIEQDAVVGICAATEPPVDSAGERSVEPTDHTQLIEQDAVAGICTLALPPVEPENGPDALTPVDSPHEAMTVESIFPMT